MEKDPKNLVNEKRKKGGKEKESWKKKEKKETWKKLLNLCNSLHCIHF